MDAGLLAAMFACTDSHHASVKNWMAAKPASLLTVEPVHRPEAGGLARIATLDSAGFSVYRINGRQRFELALLG